MIFSGLVPVHPSPYVLADGRGGGRLGLTRVLGRVGCR